VAVSVPLRYHIVRQAQRILELEEALALEDKIIAAQEDSIRTLKLGDRIITFYTENYCSRKAFEGLHELLRETQLNGLKRIEHHNVTVQKERAAKSMSESDVKKFVAVWKYAPQFKMGMKKGQVNLRAFERLLKREFNNGLGGRKFNGDGKTAKMMMKELRLS